MQRRLKSIYAIRDIRGTRLSNTKNMGAGARISPETRGESRSRNPSCLETQMDRLRERLCEPYACAAVPEPQTNRYIRPIISDLIIPPPIFQRCPCKLTAEPIVENAYRKKEKTCLSPLRRIRSWISLGMLLRRSNLVVEKLKKRKKEKKSSDTN